jgi:PAS domain S-box-containing protein
MRILIVDDHELVRKGVRTLLRERSDFEICGEGVDGCDAIEKALTLTPDLIVMDISMPKLNGLEATREIHEILPHTDILVLSQHEAPEMIRQALNAGARGYVVKSSISSDLVSAIDAVRRGMLFCDSAAVGETDAHLDVQEILQRSVAFESALRESEERFRLTFEQAAVGMAHVAPDGHWLRVNRKLCDIMGYTQEEMLQLTFQDLTHPPDLSADLEQMARVVAGEIDNYCMEKRFIHKAGHMLWGNLTVSAVRDENGKVKYFVTVTEDITTRKEAEQNLWLARRELQTTARHLELVTSKMAAPVARCSRDFRFLWANQCYADWIQRPLEEVIGRPIEEVIGKEAFAAVLPYYERVLAGERVTFEGEIEFERAGRRWVSASYTPITDPVGYPVGWVTVAVDVTERKKNEAFLRESERRFREMIDALPAAVYTTDPEGRLTHFNPAVVEFSGRLPDLENDRWCVTWRLFHPDGTPVQHEQCAMALALKGQQICAAQEGIAERPDGTRRYFTAFPRLLHDEDGKVVGGINMLVDITPRKQFEQALAEVARQQNALFQLADELLRAESLQQIYEATFSAIFAALQCDRASIALFDEKGVMRFVGWHGLSDRHRATVEGRSPWPADEKDPKPICVDNVLSAEFSKEIRATLDEEGIRAMAFIPLVSNGRLIGKFMTYFNAPHEFSENEIDLSLTIARQLAFGIDHRRASQGLRESEDRLRTLAKKLDSEVRVRTAELEERNADVLRQSEQLRQLSWQLLRAQDEERRHIARELHDSAGQTLAVLGMNVATLMQKAGRKAPDLRDAIEQADQLVQQLTREIRTTSYLLHPPLLDENGLPAALSWYVRGLAERSGLAIDLTISEQFGRLPRDLEVAVFRLVQECLTNIHRHSGSKSAVIRLARESECVRMEVRDRGKGIPPQKLSEILAKGSGVGIRGMRERVRQFQGELVMESNESGTAILVNFPVSSRAPGLAKVASHSAASPG